MIADIAFGNLLDRTFVLWSSKMIVTIYRTQFNQKHNVLPRLRRLVPIKRRRIRKQRFGYCRIRSAPSPLPRSLSPEAKEDGVSERSASAASLQRPETRPASAASQQRPESEATLDAMVLYDKFFSMQASTPLGKSLLPPNLAKFLFCHFSMSFMSRHRILLNYICNN